MLYQTPTSLQRIDWAHVCCNRVMVTSQAFTMRYGTTYTCARSCFTQLLPSPGHVNPFFLAEPASRSQARCASDPTQLHAQRRA